eukprot:TRINITY_DN2696_c0_g1_i1.p1 TRINITY_DN2696_c0_g1~~TRINITY_DN2696_c0_g1_i1.p1  ORF type:complete len:111 (+),score=41.04 TRINITY_DN2696_c0_g1_i1:21-353(+)
MKRRNRKDAGGRRKKPKLAETLLESTDDIRLKMKEAKSVQSNRERVKGANLTLKEIDKRGGEVGVTEIETEESNLQVGLNTFQESDTVEVPDCLNEKMEEYIEKKLKEVE